MASGWGGRAWSSGPPAPAPSLPSPHPPRGPPRPPGTIRSSGRPACWSGRRAREWRGRGKRQLPHKRGQPQPFLLVPVARDVGVLLGSGLLGLQGGRPGAGWGGTRKERRGEGSPRSLARGRLCLDLCPERGSVPGDLLTCPPRPQSCWAVPGAGGAGGSRAREWVGPGWARLRPGPPTRLCFVGPRPLLPFCLCEVGVVIGGEAVAAPCGRLPCAPSRPPASERRPRSTGQPCCGTRAVPASCQHLRRVLPVPPSLLVPSLSSPSNWGGFVHDLSISLSRSYSLLLRAHRPHGGWDVRDRLGPQAAYLSPAWVPRPQWAHLCSPACWSGPPREFFISGVPDLRSGIYVDSASLSLPRSLAFVLMLLLCVRYLAVLSTCLRSSCACAVWGCFSPTPPSPGRSLHTRALNLLPRRCRPWDLLP